MITVKAENVLKIANIDVGFSPDLDVSFINRLYLGNQNFETLIDACDRTKQTPLQFIQQGRKSAIHCAMLYHRFNDDVPKPDYLALAYSDGKLDRFSENVAFNIRKCYDEAYKQGYIVDLRYIDEVSKNSYRIGNILGAVIEVHRISADPEVYKITLTLNGKSVLSYDVPNQWDGCIKWVY